LTLFFGVVKTVDENKDRLYERNQRTDDGTNVFAWGVSQEKIHNNDERNEPQSFELVYWSDSERRARDWAYTMAKKFPGNAYATFTINTIYNALVTDVTERRFDPAKGLLPK
jgi:hypothetical protein